MRRPAYARYRGWRREALALWAEAHLVQPVRCRLGRHTVKFSSAPRCIHCGQVA